MPFDIETIFYSIEGVSRWTIAYKDTLHREDLTAEPICIQFDRNSYKLEPQQLMELGALFLALAGTVGIDYEAADELLDGYRLKGKEAAAKLAAALEE